VSKLIVTTWRSEDEEGLVGDKASKGAFWEILDNWRNPMRELGQDPFGDKSTDQISKKKLEALLAKGTPQRQSS
jgi:hypothetical protein